MGGDARRPLGGNRLNSTPTRSRCILDGCHRPSAVTIGAGVGALPYCLGHIPVAIERLRAMHARYVTAATALAGGDTPPIPAGGGP